MMCPRNAPPDISIHAPLAGCDPIAPSVLRNAVISIHAPLAGCDDIYLQSDVWHNISIHAPLAGCDFNDTITQL